MTAPVFESASPMFICGEDGSDTVPTVKCLACGWVGFAGGPEPGEIEEAAEERAAGGWCPDPSLHYEDNHTDLVCRSWKRDHDPDPRERLPGKRGRAFNLYRKGHDKHPPVRLQRRGDGEMVCPTCGFVP